MANLSRRALWADTSHYLTSGRPYLKIRGPLGSSFIFAGYLGYGLLFASDLQFGTSLSGSGYYITFPILFSLKVGLKSPRLRSRMPASLICVYWALPSLRGFGNSRLFLYAINYRKPTYPYKNNLLLLRWPHASQIVLFPLNICHLFTCYMFCHQPASKHRRAIGFKQKVTRQHFQNVISFPSLFPFQTFMFILATCSRSLAKYVLVLC